MMKMKKEKIWWCLFASVFAVVIVIILVLPSLQKDEDEEEAKKIVTQYYNAMEKGDYDTAFALLYRGEDTMFTDEFLIRASRNEPLLSFTIQDVHKLADDIYEVTSIIEIDDGEGEGPRTNYVIKYGSQFFFVIHWTDVPNEIFDFKEVRGY